MFEKVFARLRSAGSYLEELADVIAKLVQAVRTIDHDVRELQSIVKTPQESRQRDCFGESCKEKEEDVD